MSKLVVEKLIVYKENENVGSDVPIIYGLNATFESGKINAIMGPNGSSMSAFLDFLYGNCESTTKTTGKILYDDMPRREDTWREKACLLCQKTELINNLYVKDYLKRQLDLKAERLGIREDIQNHQYMIHRLFLENVLNKKIKKLSASEKYRLALAIEIIFERRILILDEPFSGLDSYLAFEIMAFLKQLAIEKDIMVIMTIQRPTDLILKLFDNLLIIKDGHDLYNGALVELDGFLYSHGIEKPPEMSETDFLFVAFYNDTTHNSIQKMPKNLAILLENNKKKAITELRDTVAENKSKRLVKFNVKWDEILYLAKTILSWSNLRLYYIFKITVFSIIYYIMLCGCWFNGEALFDMANKYSKDNEVDIETGITKYSVYYSITEKLTALLDLPDFEKMKPYFLGCDLDAFLYLEPTLINILFGSGFSFIQKTAYKHFRKNYFSPISYILGAFLAEMFLYLISTVLLFLMLINTEILGKISKLCLCRYLTCHFINFISTYVLNALVCSFPTNSTFTREFFYSVLFSDYYSFLNYSPNYKLRIKHFKPIFRLHRAYMSIYFIIFPSYFFRAFFDKMIHKQCEIKMENLIKETTEKGPQELVQTMELVKDSLAVVNNVFVSKIEEIYTKDIPLGFLMFLSAVLTPTIISLLYIYVNTHKTCLNP